MIAQCYFNNTCNKVTNFPRAISLIIHGGCSLMHTNSTSLQKRKLGFKLKAPVFQLGAVCISLSSIWFHNIEHTAPFEH